MTSPYQDILDAIPTAPALPAPEGNVVNVNTVTDIIRAIEDAQEGTTIVIAKGHYQMTRDALLTTHNVTIRGESNDHNDVILDCGMEFDDTTSKFTTHIGAPAAIKITHATNVTIANLTVANNPKYGILFFGDGRVNNLTVYNVKFHNIWARGLKGTGANRIDDKHPETDYNYNCDDHIQYGRPRGGQVRHCVFVADTPKQNDKDGFNGDYISGTDMMDLYDWTLSDNTFIGIQGKNGGGRGAIFIWVRSEKVTVENNKFYHCDKAIGLGNPSGQGDKVFHIRDSVIRNNEIIGGSNKGIEVDYGDNMVVENNTIESDIRKNFPAIQVINIASKATVSGNTITLHGEEAFNCDDTVTIQDNVIKHAEAAGAN